MYGRNDDYEPPAGARTPNEFEAEALNRKLGQLRGKELLDQLERNAGRLKTGEDLFEGCHDLPEIGPR